ncbi:MAG: hypothetical protein JNK26_03995 [Candidatus Doudnabacteria bacterium]|nr:hypothetical protein [Candidatus Doudnabacteria bacterium]
MTRDVEAQIPQVGIVERFDTQIKIPILSKEFPFFTTVTPVSDVPKSGEPTGVFKGVMWLTLTNYSGNCMDYVKLSVPTLPNQFFHSPNFLVDTISKGYDPNFEGYQLVVYWKPIDKGDIEGFEQILGVTNFSKNGLIPVHTGIVYEEDRIDSKFGVSGDAYYHGLNYVPYPKVTQLTWHKIPTELGGIFKRFPKRSPLF